MKRNQLHLVLVFMAMIALSACGNNKAGAPAAEGTAAEEGNDKDDAALEKKMNAYVEAINAVNKPLNEGYNYYTRYVDEATGEIRNKNSGVYFMPAINGGEAKLTALEAAYKNDPKAAVDQYAADYITKARAAIALHNELSAYYNNKSHLTDNNAKGLAQFAAYKTAIEGFRPLGKEISTAYNQYYQAGNKKYLAKLEQKGDRIRYTGNVLMNEAESLQKDFFDAIPKSGKITMTPELEAVMARTANFETLIANYTTTVESTPEAEKKRFFNGGIIISNLESPAKDLLVNIRSAVDKIKKDDDVAYEINAAGRAYDQMIGDFNRNKF